MTLKDKRTVILRIDAKDIGKWWDTCWQDTEICMRPHRYGFKSREIKIGKRYVNCYYELHSRADAKSYVEAINNYWDKTTVARLKCP